LAAAWLGLRATYPFTTPVKIMGFMDLLPSLLKGTVITLEVLIGAAILAAVMAFSAGWGKVSQVKPIRWISTVYVEVFRGTSALVQLFWLFFVLPQFGVELSPLATAIIGLGLHIGAYGAEVFRGAIKNVPRGQYEAAKAIGLSRFKTMRKIIIPQAVPAMMPPFTNLMVELLKATSLVSLITLGDLTFSGQLLRSSTLRTTEILLLLLVIYFIIASALTFVMRRIEKKVSFGLDRGGVA
jgi:polar amino acid transport system permease protein